jgi:hypothetical protein
VLGVGAISLIIQPLVAIAKPHLLIEIYKQFIQMGNGGG